MSPVPHGQGPADVLDPVRQARSGWWARQRWAPLRASYEYPCTRADPTVTLDRYARNEFRNVMACTFLPLAGVAAAVSVWRLTGWPVFRFVGIVCAAATVLWVVVDVAFFVAYLVRVRVLARRFWAARCRRRVSAQRLCCGPTWPVLRLAGPW